jgi:hypothetical protein
MTPYSKMRIAKHSHSSSFCVPRTPDQYLLGARLAGRLASLGLQWYSTGCNKDERLIPPNTNPNPTTATTPENRGL